MRFISPFPRYSIQIEEPVERITDNGRVVVVQKPKVANFSMGGISPWEKEVALKRFGSRGLPDGVPASTRMSWYDTESISRDPKNEDRVRCEQTLLNAGDYGQDYIMVEKPKLSPPWPNYGRFKDPVKIVEKVLELGFTAGEVYAYEYENENREDVKAALRKIDEPDEKIEVTA